MATCRNFHTKCSEKKTASVNMPKCIKFLYMLSREIFISEENTSARHTSDYFLPFSYKNGLQFQINIGMRNVAVVRQIDFGFGNRSLLFKPTPLACYDDSVSRSPFYPMRRKISIRNFEWFQVLLYRWYNKITAIPWKLLKLLVFINSLLSFHS